MQNAVKKKRDILLILLFAAPIFLVSLGNIHLWDLDEGFYATTSREMLQSGNWIVPQFNGELCDHKPAFMYWMQAGSFALFGVNDFAARFPSVLFSLGTLICTYFIGLRLFDRRVALLGAFALATMLMFTIAARAATPDAFLIFWATLATLIFCRAFFREDGIGNVRASSWFFIYLCLGMAVLTKGPLGFLVPTAVLGMFLLIVWLPKRKVANSNTSPLRYAVTTTLRPWHPLHFLRTCWKMHLLLAALAITLVAGPWLLMVHLKTGGAWTEGFIFTHNLGRAGNAMESHSGGLWYYPMALLFGTFPWSILFLPLLLDLIKRIKAGGRDGLVCIFLSCWVCVWIGIMSVPSTKLPSYITPLHPAFALLAASFLVRWVQEGAALRKGWLYVAASVLLVVGVTVPTVITFFARDFFPETYLTISLFGLPLLLGGGAALWALRSGKRQAFVGTLLATSFVMMLFSHGYLAVVANRDHNSAVIGEIMQQPQLRERPIFTVGTFQPSWAFYAGRPVQPTGNVRWLKPAAKQFFGTTPDAMPVDALVITKKQDVQELPRDKEYETLYEAPYFMRPEETLVILASRESIPIK